MAKKTHKMAELAVLNSQGLDLVRLIHMIRGEKIILDSDLAEIYGVSTKRLNEQVKRNCQRFPQDFMFRLNQKEVSRLRSQIATSKGRGGRRYLPSAFTEHGAIMAANVLNSRRAVQMSVFVVRAFVKMRTVLKRDGDLIKKLNQLEKELKQRLNVHETAIVEILQRVMQILDPPPLPPAPLKPKIGFH